MEDIKSWFLQNGSFAELKDLCRKYGVSFNALLGETTTSKDYLYYECCKKVGIEKTFYEKNNFYSKKETVKETPENKQVYKLDNAFDYKVKFEDLPKDLQKKVVQKGKLYNKRDRLKKELGAKTDNLPKTVAFRKKTLDEIKAVTEQIKAIHDELRRYENNEPQPETTPEPMKGEFSEFGYNEDLNTTELCLLLKKTQSAARQNKTRGQDKLWQKRTEFADFLKNKINVLQNTSSTNRT